MRGLIIILTTTLAISAVCGPVSGQLLPRQQRPPTQVLKGFTFVVRANNAFTCDLYAQLKEREGNLFFSPYSLTTSLSMTLAGAKEKTETQMARALHVPSFGTTGRRTDEGKIEDVPIFMPLSQWHAAFGTLIKQLNVQRQKGGYQLNVSNALWSQKDEGFLKEFFKLVQDDYGAGLNGVDFVNETEREKTRRTINTWVEDKTNKKIQELIKPDILNALTRLVLTNAVYFKGDWAVQFDSKNTKDAPFTIGPEKKNDVPMMHLKDSFNYADFGVMQILEMPYKGNDLSMVVLLPRKAEDLAELEKRFTFRSLEQWLKRLNKQEVLVYLPKFKITGEFRLAQVLKKVGMVDAFAPNLADFSGMNGKKDLFISAVVHQAFVEVNEEGTEAAGATGIAVGVTSIPAPPPVFRADHPFVFFIRDTKTNTILFIGRVTNPSKANSD
ncbi:serpin family protein [Planctomycetota bacterium]